MRNILVVWLIANSFILADLLYAKTPGGTEISPPVTWSSKNSNDTVTIQNGTGAALLIQININAVPNVTAAGINIRNCGATTHVNAGSSAICYTNDASNPVSFSSDSPGQAVGGTYYIKQQS